MSEVKVDKISPKTGTSMTVGDSGDTFTVPSGATLTVAGALNVTGTTSLADGTVAVAELDIDGATDIGAGIADADLFVVDDNAAGANRKTAASRLKTYILADNSIDSDMYVDGSIDNAHLADDAVDSDEIAAGAIDAAHMSANSIDSASYVDGSIDTAHIGALQVTGAKLNTDVISAQTATTAEPVNTDEFMVSDGGVLKRIDYSLIKSGMVRVGGGSATTQNVGDISFDVFSADYTLYYCQYAINFVTGGSQLWLRMRNGSGYKTNAGYRYAFMGGNSGGTTPAIYNATGDSKFLLTGGTLSNDDHNSGVGHFMFYQPYSSSHNTDVTYSCLETDDSGGMTARHGGGGHQVAETHVGFGFLGSSQNIEAYDVQIFGLKES